MGKLGAVLSLLTCLGLLGGWLWLRRRYRFRGGPDAQAAEPGEADETGARPLAAIPLGVR